MIRKHKIRIVCAAEEDILPARAELAHRGIYAEHTTAASLAAYYTYCRQYGPTHDALLSMCSAGIKSDHGEPKKNGADPLETPAPSLNNKKSASMKRRHKNISFEGLKEKTRGAPG